MPDIFAFEHPFTTEPIILVSGINILLYMLIKTYIKQTQTKKPLNEQTKEQIIQKYVVIFSELLNEMNTEEKSMMKATIENTFINAKIASKLHISNQQRKKNKKKRGVSFQEEPQIVEIRN